MKRWLLAGTLALAASGQAVASDLPPPASAPAAYVPSPSPVYNWGGIYFGFNLGYGFGTSIWSDPSIPAAGRPAISTCRASSPASRSAQISPRRISTAPGSMARSPAHSVVLGRNARPRTSGFRLCADGSVTLLIGYCSMAPRAAHLAMLHWGKAAAFSIAFTENLTARIEYLYLKLGNATCTSPTACGSDLGLPGGTSNPNDTAKFSTNIIRFGLDYKFR